VGGKNVRKLATCGIADPNLCQADGAAVLKLSAESVLEACLDGNEGCRKIQSVTFTVEGRHSQRIAVKRCRARGNINAS
jgi:hypothetical protein